jgi:uncharacterized protein (DUF2147 family)
MKRSFVASSMFSIILLASTLSSASATNAWTQSEHLPYVHHTSSNPRNIKICGDHICKPFENYKKPQVVQNSTTQFVKQNHSIINKSFNKIVAQITKSLTNIKKE